MIVPIKQVVKAQVETHNSLDSMSFVNGENPFITVTHSKVVDGIRVPLPSVDLSPDSIPNGVPLINPMTGQEIGQTMPYDQIMMLIYSMYNMVANGTYTQAGALDASEDVFAEPNPVLPADTTNGNI